MVVHWSERSPATKSPHFACYERAFSRALRAHGCVYQRMAEVVWQVGELSAQFLGHEPGVGSEPSGSLSHGIEPLGVWNAGSQDKHFHPHLHCADAGPWRGSFSPGAPGGSSRRSPAGITSQIAAGKKHQTFTIITVICALGCGWIPAETTMPSCSCATIPVPHSAWTKVCDTTQGRCRHLNHGETRQ